ncbi:MAG: exodeoxyribonuclease III [Puniceicoccales bacterium]|jgi:exodeoxyribonuclease-3|nr:exodeoxyribonuclease III [Puniceicoccales bacterium]
MSKDSQLCLYSWNVNGIRSVSAKTLDSFLEKYSPDILCLQEIKATMPQSGDLSIPYPYQFFHSADKAGYAGTAILSRVAPLRVTMNFPGDHPQEGRVISAEFSGCYVVCAYVPNSQRELARLDYRLRWDADFQKHISVLAKRKPVLVCGDFNCAHEEIDLANPKQNRRNAGFTDEERGSFSKLLANGFDDTFRLKNPGCPACYSWWTYRMNARERNIGWRLDYWLASRQLADAWSDPAIHADVLGSDHCPVSLKVDEKLFK